MRRFCHRMTLFKRLLAAAAFYIAGIALFLACRDDCTHGLFIVTERGYRGAVFDGLFALRADFVARFSGGLACGGDITFRFNDRGVVVMYTVYFDIGAGEGKFDK